jgi:hypothetical protein
MRVLRTDSGVWEKVQLIGKRNLGTSAAFGFPDQGVDSRCIFDPWNRGIATTNLQRLM